MIYGATGRSCLAEKFMLKLFTFLEVFYSDQIVKLEALKVYCFKFNQLLSVERIITPLICYHNVFEPQIKLREVVAVSKLGLNNL